MEKCLNEIPEIKVHGRTTDCRSPLTLFWTASGFECNISGSEFWVEVEVSYDNYEPWFSYTINGDWVGRQMMQQGRYWIPLFRGMNPEKTKHVRFYKDLQAMSGDANSFIQIHGFRFDGTFYPVEEKPYKIEFIGDSITSGEGLFGAKEEEDWIPMFFSSLRNYVHMTAERLDAEYRVFSQSGWGIRRSWDNKLECAVPKYYREICSLVPGERIKELGGMQKHDFSSWQPDTVVINLGTNDASASEDYQYIDEDVAAFLKTLRECNPKAKLIWCYGMFSIELEDTIQKGIQSYCKETQDENVFYLRLPQTREEQLGSRYHPGILAHQEVAELLASYIEKIK